MNWFGGILEVTCVDGNTHKFHNVSLDEAQRIIDEQFKERAREALYHPYPISMAYEKPRG